MVRLYSAPGRIIAILHWLRKLDRVICVYSGVIRTHIRLKQALAEAHGSDGPVQITYNNFLTLDVPAAHAVVAAVGLAPNANPNDGTDLSMPAQGVPRTGTVDPNTGLKREGRTGFGNLKGGPDEIKSGVTVNVYFSASECACVARHQ